MKLLEDFKHLPVKQQKSLITSLAIVAFLIAVSCGANVVLSAYNTPQTNAAIQSEQSDQSEPAISPEIAARQQQAQSRYTKDEKEFLDILEHNTWVDGNEKSVISFSDTIIKEQISQNIKSRPYVLSAFNFNRVVDSNNPSFFTVMYTAALEMDSQTYLMQVSRRYAQNGYEKWQMHIGQGAFSSTRYMPSKNSGTFEVKGITPEFDKLVGGKTAQLKDTLHAFCETYYPTASELTWSGQVRADYKTGDVSTEFIVNNYSHSRIPVVYSSQKQAFEVGKSK